MSDDGGYWYEDLGEPVPVSAPRLVAYTVEIDEAGHHVGLRPEAAGGAGLHEARARAAPRF